MVRPSTRIVLSVEQEGLLKESIRPTTQYRFVQRINVVLLAAEGLSNKEVSGKVGLSAVSVSHWRTRFAKHGVEGLNDLPRSGKPCKYGHSDRLKVVNAACSPPSLKARWTVRELAEKTGISKSHLHRIMHELDLKPHQFRMWLFSSDPEFEAKQADIVGLYINPPKNAFVICLDEKTGLQAVSPAHEKLPVKPGHAERRDARYRRHGALALYAALKVHEGEILGRTEKRFTHAEFLSFIKTVHRRWGGGKELHFIVDNFSAHKHKDVMDWLEGHKTVHLHFTPTHASWLNQMELWFSILARQLLSKKDFKTTEDLTRQVLQFIQEYNKKAKPFAWTYKGKPLTIN
jgi:putative transposase